MKDNKIFYVVLIIIFVGVISYFIYNNLYSKTNNKKINNIKDQDRIKLVSDSNINFLNSNNTFISNEDCDSKNKKYNYTLTLDDGQILINNLDTYENFKVENIKGITSLNSITYGTCADSIYVLLNNDGKIYYTDNNIVGLKKLKDIDKEFRILKTDYIFDNIVVSDNKLYGSTNNGEIVEINLK